MRSAREHLSDLISTKQGHLPGNYRFANLTFLTTRNTKLQHVNGGFGYGCLQTSIS
jgi:hypothetical protein